MKRFWLCNLFCLVLVFLDHLSKQMALAWIPLIQWNAPYPFGGMGLFSSFITCSLNTTFNTGAAWGLFADHFTLLFGIRLIAVLGLIGYQFLKKETRLALWCITAGAMGNLLDDVLFLHVVDFIHFTFWGHTFPIFNFADSYITIGGCLLFLTPRRKHAELSRV